VTTEGGHGREFGGPYPPPIGGADEAQQFVDDRIAEGSDYIKIVYDFYGTPGNLVEDGTTWRGGLPSIDRATPGAVIRAAHARGKLVVVHALNLESARHALEEGADGLAHLFVDSVPDAEFLERAARSGLFVVPTLSLLDGYTRDAQQVSLTDSSTTAYLPPMGEALIRLTGTLASQIPDAEAWRQRLSETVRLLQSAGVTLLAGTDAFNPGTTPGLGLHEELADLVEAGVSPTAALEATTSIPAEIFGLSDRGRVETGRRADLLLVEGDPTADIAATRHIVGIWKLGVRVDRESYRERFAEVRARYEALQAPGTTLVADFEGDGRGRR
jgi:imidazolonepropionase-like amidohydrolase